MESEGELAGVMAHEMSHVYYRHIAQRMKQSGPVNMASLAGLLAGLLLGGLTGSPQLGQAVAMGSLAGGAQKQLAFSREAEEQADYGGYKIITGLGYPPQEMENSFTRLARQARFTGPGAIPAYLRTHPTSPERMEKIQNLIRRYHPRIKRYDNMPFLRIRTRLIALYEPEDTARDSFHRRLRAHPGDPLALYGLALLAMRRSQYDGALALLKQLAEKWPGDIAVSRARGVCLLRQGEFAKAQATLLGVLRKSPQDQGALLALGQCYLKQDRLSRARDALSRVLKMAPDNEQAQYDLGITLGLQGHGVEASLHLGLAFKTRGNIRAARYHLKRAEEGLSAKPKLRAKAAEALKELHKLEKLRRKRSAEEGFGPGARPFEK
jgi:predicted Zn-dependent protease